MGQLCELVSLNFPLPFSLTDVCPLGHDTISINSRSCLAPLYGATTSIEKSDAYRLPGHKDVVCLFYKQNKAAHSERKKIWTAALTTSRYFLCIRFSLNLIRASVKNYMPYMESRASELFDCIQDRQRTNGGSVNLGQCFSDWSYDLMVWTCFRNTVYIELTL